MTDIVSPAVRSTMMAGIRGANTKIEHRVRKSLYGLGVRYRLHDRSLPGSPDLVLRRHEAIIFVHGCFWHCHDCHLMKWPATRPEFWREKLLGNQARDQRQRHELIEMGWRVLVVWECTLRGPGSRTDESVATEIKEWLESGEPGYDIAGSGILG